MRIGSHGFSRSHHISGTVNAHYRHESIGFV